MDRSQVRPYPNNRLLCCTALQYPLRHIGLKHVATFVCVDRGCIFPTIHPVNEPFLPTSLEAFAAMRTIWPCTLKACQILLSTKMLNLVVSLLGKGACLFNDQVRLLQ